MDIEDEIVKILDAIKIKDIRSISEINSKNEEIINIVFENFLKYQKNKENSNGLRLS